MSAKRAAFTLVELMVVIALVAILVSLLLPAVQAIRESARQVECRNHLKQIALACQHYQSAFRELPGYRGERPPFLIGYRLPRTRDANLLGGNWLIEMMGFLEETPLTAGLGTLASMSQVVPDPRVQAFVATPVPSLHCPTRRDAQAYPLLEPFRSRYGEAGARTDYAMSGGPALVSEEDPRIITSEHDGVWVLGRRTRPRDLSDGLSTTYLVGEKAMDSLRYRTGDCYGDRSPLAGYSDVRSTVHSYVRYAARPPRQDHANNCLSCHDFGSAHPHGWNMAMADGSVRTIGYSIDMEIHRGLASADGRETELGVGP